jgi:hypothetical protein
LIREGALTLTVQAAQLNRQLTGRWRTLVVGVAVFAFALFCYYFVGGFLKEVFDGTLNAKPVNWLNFYTYVAKAMTEGSLDLRNAGLTGQEHPDLLVKDGEVYLPYGPTPALLMIPAVLLFGVDDTAQWFHSMIVGAINVVLFWYILRLLGTSRSTKLLLIPFFAFGTANFYAATTGTIWFYNHVTAVMFLLLAIIFLLRGSSPLIPAAFLGLALLARQPVLLAAPAFMYFYVRQAYPTVFTREWLRDRKTIEKLSFFVGGLAPFVLILLWYNAVRFGSPFDTGLDEIYDKYNGQIYTIYLKNFGTADRFAEFDIRNVFLHLYTIFLMPPTFEPAPFVQGEWQNTFWLRPSEYGMSVLITSSPFVYSVFVQHRKALRNMCWLAIPIIAIPTLMYYSQGWVQFGYRYLMDYLPFIMILTAMGFEEFRSPRSLWIKIALVVLSVAIGFWGRYWGTRLGW